MKMGATLVEGATVEIGATLVEGLPLEIGEWLSLLLKKVGSARLRESDIHPISPKTPAP